MQAAPVAAATGDVIHRVLPNSVFMYYLIPCFKEEKAQWCNRSGDCLCLSLQATKSDERSDMLPLLCHNDGGF